MMTKVDMILPDDYAEMTYDDTELKGGDVETALVVVTSAISIAAFVGGAFMAQSQYRQNQNQLRHEMNHEMYVQAEAEHVQVENAICENGGGVRPDQLHHIRDLDQAMFLEN